MNGVAVTDADPEVRQRSGLLSQPKSVWAVAFACAVSFMGIGLVDPILPTIASELHATPAQVSLLFTSYLAVTAVTMLFTSWISSRIGAKKTLITGLIVVTVSSALAGVSTGVDGIIGFRAGWGLGNALFLATALAVIVGAPSGGFAGAIMLFEAALGVGFALGPMLGGLLGGFSWRAPFFGVALLMGIALICVVTLLAPTPPPARRTSISEPLKALRHRGLLTPSLTALLYNWGFFTVLGYAPYPMKSSVIQLGFVFFGWGVLVAICAVFVAPYAQRRIGTAGSLYVTLLLMSLDVAAIGYWVDRPGVIAACVIISGAFIGMNNTLVTGTVMRVAPVPRPTASAAYSFVRFIGGAIAPWVAGVLAARHGAALPFYVGAGAVALGIPVLATAHRLIATAHVKTAREVEDAAERLVELTEGDVLHGQLLGPDGGPVTGAVLTLVDPAGRQVASGLSSAEGYYHLVGPHDGSYLLIVSVAGHPTEACPVELHPAPTQLSLQLDEEGTVNTVGRRR